MRLLAMTLTAAALAGCSSHPAESRSDSGVPPVADSGRTVKEADSGPQAVTIPIGSLSLRVVPETANVSILAPGGALLLEGIDPSNAVGTPWSANDDAPPMTGFAARDLSSAYTMLFGSFEVVDDTSQPWHVVKTARVSGSHIDLLAADGTRLASLAASQGDDSSHVVVAITADEDAPDASADSGRPATPHLVGLPMHGGRPLRRLRRPDLGGRRPRRDHPHLGRGRGCRQGSHHRRPDRHLVPRRAQTLGVHAAAGVPLEPRLRHRGRQHLAVHLRALLGAGRRGADGARAPGDREPLLRPLAPRGARPVDGALRPAPHPACLRLCPVERRHPRIRERPGRGRRAPAGGGAVQRHLDRGLDRRDVERPGLHAERGVGRRPDALSGLRSGGAGSARRGVQVARLLQLVRRGRQRGLAGDGAERLPGARCRWWGVLLADARTPRRGDGGFVAAGGHRLGGRQDEGGPRPRRRRLDGRFRRVAPHRRHADGRIGDRSAQRLSGAVAEGAAPGARRSHRRRRRGAAHVRALGVARDRAARGRVLGRRPAHQLRGRRRDADRRPHRHRRRARGGLDVRQRHRRLPERDQSDVDQGAVLPLGRSSAPGRP